MEAEEQETDQEFVKKLLTMTKSFKMQRMRAWNGAMGTKSRLQPRYQKGVSYSHHETIKKDPTNRRKKSRRKKKSNTK